MSTNDRIKRPPLERTDPVRNWSTLLNAASSAASTGEPAPNRDQPSGLGDAISRSVAIGYQVVEEYVRQGERAARRMTEGASPTGVTADAQDLVQRMGHYATELAGMWLELVQRTTMASAPARDGAGAAARTTATPAAAPAPAPVRSARVRLDVRCSRPVEVAIDLTPEAAGARFVVHALRACDAWKPRIDDVQVRSGEADDGPTFSVGIPDGHPPGTYEGLIVDAVSNRPVGVVRVVLLGSDSRPG